VSATVTWSEACLPATAFKGGRIVARLVPIGWGAHWSFRAFIDFRENSGKVEKSRNGQVFGFLRRTWTHSGTDWGAHERVRLYRWNRSARFGAARQSIYNTFCEFVDFEEKLESWTDRDFAHVSCGAEQFTLDFVR
jgi:hypothetical protein